METRSTTAATTALIPSVFSEVAERLKDWRRTRRRGNRIPEELWRAAASLAEVHGLSPTSAALKLNYYALQRRLGPLGKGQRVSGAPAFVQLPNLVSAQPDPGTVEVVHANGSRLTLRLSQPRSRDLSALLVAFLRA